MQNKRYEITIILICLILFTIMFVISLNRGQVVEEVSYTAYTIQAGDTIYDIASNLDRNENIQKTVCEIRRDNNNLDPMLKIGQVILIREEN